MTQESENQYECSDCGATIERGDCFCKKCGAKLEWEDEQGTSQDSGTKSLMCEGDKKMVCPHCNVETPNDWKYCINCGSTVGRLPHPSEQPNQTTVVESPTPTALIASAWVVLVLQFFDRAFGPSLAIVFDVAALICPIVLISSKNHIGKTNGWIILVLWLVWFFIGFITGYVNRVNGLF